MHIPDGFLNNGAAGSLMGAAVAAVAFAVRKVRSAFLEKVPVLRARLATFPDFGGESALGFRRQLSEGGQEKMWRMASLGALVFSAQMINFPIGDGTSGHMLGGVLVALVAGPFEALLVMTAVLSIQAFVFGDGGVLALGANIFNMGIIGALGGHAFFRFLAKGRNLKLYFLRNVFVAAWVSVIVASIAASIEIAISGTKPLNAVLPAMTLVHTAIGFMEGIVTVGILSVLLRRGFALDVLMEDVSSQEYENENSKE
ncbi:MAG: energy-coupling factor ABC transporter permease [Candidatus Moraniibacteriota bacterium]|nr:MAG: energy-coupling factor ABC transporter permease [Candidatus Moranbacteria bacterium]